jgi:NADPH-dependent curcumin reductase CurA
MPEPANFDLADVDLPEPVEGQVLVRNRLMSVDPYMRPRMDDAESYTPPFRVGEPLDGPAVGEVVASGSDSLAAGDLVFHWSGWRDLALCDQRSVRRLDTDLAPPEAHLSVLGMTGFTAYLGLTEIAGVREGDVVFVSGAAGAVGSVAGQMAKLLGARTIGSAGSDEKVARCLELGFDEAFNYRAGPVLDALRCAAPDGISVYFDNVGGEHLEAALEVLNDFGRVAMCGTISAYNAGRRAQGLHNQFRIVQRRLTLRGFLVRDHWDRWDGFAARAGAWLSEGRLVRDETIVEGLENAPEAFIGMLQGRNLGKMLVRVG